MAYRTINVDVDVEVNMSDFETQELIDELESRGFTGDHETKHLIEAIYRKRRLGKDFMFELDTLIYHTLGKIV
jgi:hypothetical protein